MIEIIRRCFCDACGEDITNSYSSSRRIFEVDGDENFMTADFYFCKECTKSFNAWLNSREGTSA